MTCSPGWNPRSTRAWPRRFRRPTNSAHDQTRSPSMSAGLSGWRAAWAPGTSIPPAMEPAVPAEGTREHDASPALRPMIVVDRASALIDEPVALELRGYAPRQPIILTASIEFADGSRWQSHAAFVADEAGSVDVTRQAPVSGTYESVADM